MRLQLQLRPIPPFRMDLTAWCLKRRPIDILHRWDGTTLSRPITVGDTENGAIPLMVALSSSGTVDAPVVDVVAEGPAGIKPYEQQIFDTASKMIGADIDLSQFYKMTIAEPALAQLIKRFRGVKPPRFPSIYETFVCSVACQQLTLQVGITLLNRIVETFGLPVKGSKRKTFPSPHELANVAPDQLMALSFSRNKANYIIDMAQNIVEGVVDLDALCFLTDEELFDALKSLRGIGRWSAQYIMLRGFGRLTTFPIDDTGARAKLTKVLERNEKVSWDYLEEIAQQWKPYQGMLYFHLLMSAMEQEGILQ